MPFRQFLFWDSILARTTRSSNSKFKNWFRYEGTHYRRILISLTGFFSIGCWLFWSAPQWSGAWRDKTIQWNQNLIKLGMVIISAYLNQFLVFRFWYLHHIPTMYYKKLSMYGLLAIDDDVAKRGSKKCVFVGVNVLTFAVILKYLALVSFWMCLQGFIKMRIRTPQ